MKKIVYLLSAIGAAFAGTAHADISVSGSATSTYASSDANQYVNTSGGIAFALSTTTAGGMGISAAGGITTDLEGTAARGSTGLTSLTFATGGATIVIGNDVAAPQIGNVGSVAGDMVDQGHQTINASPAVGTDADQDGSGISLTTAVGGGSLTAVYVWDGSPSLSGKGQGNPDAADTSMGFSFSMPAGAATLTIGHSTSDDTSSENDTLSGITVAYPAMGGTLSAGYQQSAGQTKATAISAAYSMSLDADTSLAIGIKSADEGAQAASTTEAKISRALGGGASVYAEVKSSSGNSTGVTASAGSSTTFAIGTSVAF